MNISALVIDFMGVLLQVRTDVPNVEHFSPYNKTAAVPGSNPGGYNPLDHYELNLELLAYLRQFNLRWPVILFSSGQVARDPQISPQLEGIFKRIITTNDIHFEKTESEAYLAVAYHIGRTPQELLFVDDSLSNLAAAKTAGCVTHQYTGNEELIKLLGQATA